MSKDCCGAKEEALSQLRTKQGKVLKIVLLLNVAMFIVEAVSGWLANSTSLLADSLDMFGDSVVYGFSLYVLGKDLIWRAHAGLLKGVIMLIFGVVVMTEAGVKIFSGAMPIAETIGWVGILALIANSLCLWILWSHKDDDINMKSTWICSRNDIVANCGVLLAALGTAWSQSRWFDIGIGMLIAILFLRSAAQVIGESLAVIGKSRPT